MKAGVRGPMDQTTLTTMALPFLWPNMLILFFVFAPFRTYGASLPIIRDVRDALQPAPVTVERERALI